MGSIIRSIRWRIAIPYVLLITVTMVGLGIYLSSFIRQTYLSSLEEKLVAEAKIIANDISSSPEIGNQYELLDEMAKHWADAINARITIIAPDGLVIGESHDDRTLMDNHLNRPEVVKALEAGQGTSTRYSKTVGYEMMYTAVTVPGSGSSPAIVRVAVPLVNVQLAITQLQNTLIGATIIVAFLAVLLAIMIAARTTRPILELTLAVQELAEHATDRNSSPQRIVSSTNDEIGQLSAAFNLMASQVSSQIDALVAESSKLNAVLDQMTDGVVIADDQGQVQMINPAAERMFKVNSSKAIGRSLVEVLRHHQLVEIWQSCRKTGQLQAVVLELNLERTYLQAVATPLGEALPGSILLLLQDLTQLRRLETIRRDFISNISHELRTPLASLKALAETLQEHALDDPQAARRFLQRMETEVDALSLMVLELLELSRIESGKVPLAFEAVDPAIILASARDRLHLQAERANLHVEIDCPAGLPKLLVDPPRVEQVVVNLLHNAIKFTPEGGYITLSARLYESSNKQIIMAVHDTGVGIPADDMPRIFERFYKADRSRSGGGTGLGLAIAKHLVEAHSGQIWVESFEGRGSTFYFTLPIDRGIDDKEN